FGFRIKHRQRFRLRNALAGQILEHARLFRRPVQLCSLQVKLSRLLTCLQHSCCGLLIEARATLVTFHATGPATTEHAEAHADERVAVCRECIPPSERSACRHLLQAAEAGGWARIAAEPEDVAHAE